MHYIIGNFGNHSLAVMQYLIETCRTNVNFVYIETGLESPCWRERISVCADYATKNQIEVHRLQAPFSDLIINRKQFPSQKFQWCTTFIKGLPLIDFLDKNDPACEAIIISGKRKVDSRRFTQLEEWEYHNEHYQGRTLWHPLLKVSDEAFIQLIKRAGFQPLSHPSLECSPCIHITNSLLKHLDVSSIERLEQLERSIGQTMFEAPIREFVDMATKASQTTHSNLYLEQFDLGCGTSWNCGE